MKHFHYFKSDISGVQLPNKFTFPFYYEPHLIAKIAVTEIQNYLESQNDFKHNFGLDSTQNDLPIGKMFGVLLAILAMFIAPLIDNAPDGLFGYLQEVNGCYSIPILTIIIVGYVTKKVPAIAAKIAILSGVILYSISQFILKPQLVQKAVQSAEAAGITGKELAYVEAAAYPHFLHVMAILFVLNILIMLLIGRFYPRTENFQLQYTNQVDITPWKYVNQVGIAVCIIVLLIYIYFSPLMA